jgi:hypothetical protein
MLPFLQSHLSTHLKRESERVSEREREGDGEREREMERERGRGRQKAKILLKECEESSAEKSRSWRFLVEER